MRCPICSGEMAELSRTSRPDLKIDRCSCGTLWFDCSELAEYLRTVENQKHVEVDSDVPYRPRVDESLVKCPRCRDEALKACFLKEAHAHWCVRCFGFLIHESQIKRTHTDPRSALAEENLIEQRMQRIQYEIANREAGTGASAEEGVDAAPEEGIDASRDIRDFIRDTLDGLDG